MKNLLLFTPNFGIFKEYRTFAVLESATLPIEQRTRAELFLYIHYSNMDYTNSPLEVLALIQTLKDRVPQHEILESWMKSINALRNACAHHERIWNRVMPVIPQLPNTLRNSWITTKPQSSNRFYAVFCCLIYWLNSIDPQNTLIQDFKHLVQIYPNVDTAAMGFPQNWKEEPFWR